MALDGIFLGGVARGQETARTLGLEESRLALADQQLQADERARVMETAQTQFDRTMETIGSVFEASNLSTDETWAKNEGTLSGLLTQAAMLGETLGIPTETVLAQAGAYRTSRDAALAEAGIESEATIEGFRTLMGRDPTEEEMASLAGVGAQADPLIVQLQKARDEAIAAGNQEAANEISAQIVRLGESGGQEINIYPDATPLGSAGTNTVEGDLIDTSASMQRLQAVQQSFRSEYLEVTTRAGFAWDAMRDKFGDLNEAEQQELADFSVFKRRAFDNLNQTLREMSGAAISQQEFDRLTQALPNPGEGIFDGDSPTQFKAKLDDVVWQLQLANARLLHLRSRGIEAGEDFGGISLTQMEQVIRERGYEIEDEVRAEMPDAGDDAIQLEAATRVRQEFGLF